MNKNSTILVVHKYISSGQSYIQAYCKWPPTWEAATRLLITALNGKMVMATCGVLLPDEDSGAWYLAASKGLKVDIVGLISNIQW